MFEPLSPSVGNRLPRWLGLLAGRGSLKGLTPSERMVAARRAFILRYGVINVVFWVLTVVFLPAVGLAVPLMLSLLYLALVLRMTTAIRQAQAQPEPADRSV